MKQDLILIIDLGSEENSQLARMIRDFGVYSEICAHDVTEDELRAKTGLKGIILNGGRNRVVDGEAVAVGDHVARFGVPVISFDTEPSGGGGGGGGGLPPSPSAVREFVFGECGAVTNWNMRNFVEDQVDAVRKQVGDRKVLLALSGGVDSSVVAALLIKAIGKQLYCVHVNHGLMRKGESEQVVQVFREELGANLTYVDASER
ncbi:MAG: asparagine synthase-related protein, partial [Eubacteriales bacterium]|nr:asparagine synthase-related protein [Eubacteriales bacterium]